MTVNGKTIGENVATTSLAGRQCDSPREPLSAEGGIAMLYGNLAPNGAVIKQTAASAELLQHRGRA